MATLIITEKSSQARDLRAALGDRYGRIMPAEGHLLRLAEPEEVNADWKRWSTTLLKPDGLFPTKPDGGGNKPAKLKAIEDALKCCDQVILATDCDREGQLIGQEILEHFGYRGAVRRALFTAQDPKTIRDAFQRLKPNEDMRPLYDAAVARRQADQIFNLSLTRTVTVAMRAPGARGVIGIGRVKTPTLAIVCLRELEIRDFKPEDYFEVAATATVAAGRFQMRHAPPPKDRVKDRRRAEAVAAAAVDCAGPLSVTVEDRRQGPPKLFDLPALQKTCGQRWGWSADKTLSVAQELYDGDGKKLITYPRAEARYLAENQIDDAPVIAAALTALRGFAHIDLARPVIRRGKSGHFYDKGLEGVSHHAVVPNVNVMQDLETRLARLNDDEKRLFGLICRSYLAALLPDFEYRQTIATMTVAVPGEAAAEFRASGRMPIKLGWRAVYVGAEQQQDGDKRDADEQQQDLPTLTNGEPATLTDPTVEAKRTQPPPRYNEGTLVDAMQNAWRFVDDPALRDRLKEAKGIGTPATRAEVIKGLRRQALIDAQGKWLHPTAGGLALFERLRAAAPALVDPGTTAVWEMRLDDVTTGRGDFRAVIDGVAGEAGRLIDILARQSGGALPLAAPSAPFGKRTGAKRTGAKQAETKRAGGPRRKKAEGGTATTTAANITAAKTTAAKTGGRKRKAAAPNDVAPNETASAENPTVKMPIGKMSAGKMPTDKMIAFARQLAERRGEPLPDAATATFDGCRAYLDRHGGALRPVRPASH